MLWGLSKFWWTWQNSSKFSNPTWFTRNTIDPFKNDPFWPATHLTHKLDWLDPTHPFCHIYQRWVDWDWGIILIKYLLFIYLICYLLHYSLSATFIFSSYFKQIEDYTKISFYKAGTRVAPNLGIKCLVVIGKW